MTRTQSATDRSPRQATAEPRREGDSSERRRRSSRIAPLQRSVGNRVVQALFEGDREEAGTAEQRDTGACHTCSSSGVPRTELGGIQSKRVTGGRGERLEREADRAAARAVRGSAGTNGSEPSADPAAPTLQRSAAGREGDASSESDGKGQGSGGDGRVSRSRAASTPPFVDGVLGRGGRPIEPDTRADMERQFGHDFSGVRVHTGPRAAASARVLGAAAYTIGEHVAFGAGRYRPSQRTGQQLLAHELAHVVQQGGGQRLAQDDHGGGGPVAQSLRARGPSGPAIQRQTAGGSDLPGPVSPSCVALLNMPGYSTSGLGQTVQNHLEADFQRTVGPTESFAIPGGTADPLRTEGRPGSDSFIEPETFDPIDPHPMKGTGIPDIAHKNGDVMELIEVKPAHWASLVFAEEQVSRYVRHGNAEYNESLRARFGVSRFERMSPGRYRPPSRVFVGGRAVYVSWCGPGVIVYKPAKGRRKPEPEPVPEPVWEPFAALAGVLALRLVKEALRQLNPGRKVRVALAMIAAAVVMSSSTATAELDPSAEGQDPISTLYRAMEDNGVPPPPELKARIENNPELRKRLEASITSGDPTAGQAALNQELVSLVDQNADEFSDAELEALLTASQVAGGSLPESERTVAGLKRAIERRSQGAEGRDAGSEAERQDPGGERTSEGRGGSKGQREEERARSDSPSERWLADASPPQQRLFDAMVERSDVGPRVDAEAVRQFRDAVPNLTSAEASELIARLSRVEGQTVQQITAQLSATLSQLRAGDSDGEAEREEAPTGPVGHRDTQGAVEGREEPAREVVIEAGMSAIEAFGRWDQLDPGDTVFVVDGADPIDTPVGETIIASVYLKRSGDGARATGRVSFKVLLENDSPPRESVVCLAVSDVQLVYENRTVRRVSRSALGRLRLGELDL